MIVPPRPKQCNHVAGRSQRRKKGLSRKDSPAPHEKTGVQATLPGVAF